MSEILLGIISRSFHTRTNFVTCFMYPLIIAHMITRMYLLHGYVIWNMD